MIFLNSFEKPALWHFFHFLSQCSWIEECPGKETVNRLSVLCLSVSDKLKVLLKTDARIELVLAPSLHSAYVLRVLASGTTFRLILLHTHTHTHISIISPSGLCLGLPGWAGTRKVKPIWILLKQLTVSGSGISWAICKSAPCPRQISCQHPTTISWHITCCPCIWCYSLRRCSNWTLITVIIIASCWKSSVGLVVFFFNIGLVMKALSQSLMPAVLLWRMHFCC